MKRILISACITATGMTAAVMYAGADPVVVPPSGTGPITASYIQFNDAFTGDWQQYGQLFTTWQGGLFNRIFLLVLALMPTLFLLHYIAIGAKRFSHEGTPVLFFGVFIRFIHWLMALSFSLLVITGLMVVFGKLLGGGTMVMTGRALHILSAIAFIAGAIPMFFLWLKDMLPMPHDLAWMFIMGGYLTKKKKPIPAGKFNAGQKIWFWLATVGGFVMTYTGYILWGFQGSVNTLRLMAIIHNFLGAAMIAFFIIHLYMSLFAIKGSLISMISGYKPREEVEIMHSRYNIP